MFKNDWAIIIIIMLNTTNRPSEYKQITENAWKMSTAGWKPLISMNSPDYNIKLIENCLKPSPEGNLNKRMNCFRKTMIRVYHMN